MLQRDGIDELARQRLYERTKLSRDGILRSLTAKLDPENAAAAKRPRLAEEANDMSLAPHDLKRHTREAEAA